MSKPIGWGYVDGRGSLRVQRAKPTAQTKDAKGRPVIPFPLYTETGVPPARLRAMVRLLSPQEMTPTATRQLNLLCEEYE